MSRKLLTSVVVVGMFLAVSVALAQEQLLPVGSTTIPEASPDDSTMFFVVGGPDTSTWGSARGPMPSMCLDRDGCTITIICQHETKKNDEVRVNTYPFGFEYVDDDYGKRGRSTGIYGSTPRDEKGFILGDSDKSVLISFRPKNADSSWAILADYEMKGGGQLLGEDNVIFYSDPKVTTRVIIRD